MLTTTLLTSVPTGKESTLYMSLLFWSITKGYSLPVTVTVTKDIVILTPKLSQFVNTSYTVTSKTVMRME